MHRIPILAAPLITLSGCIIAPEAMPEEENSAIRSYEAEIDGDLTLDDICPKLYEDKGRNIQACAEFLEAGDLSDIEAIEEVVSNSPEAGACQVACRVAYTAACIRITQVCATATVVSLGSASVPCATATYAVCLGGIVLDAVCENQCP